MIATTPVLSNRKRNVDRMQSHRAKDFATTPRLDHASRIPTSATVACILLLVVSNVKLCVNKDAVFVQGFHVVAPTPVRHASHLVRNMVSVGLGPDEKKDGSTATDEEEEERELIPGVDYEIPNHEEYRTSRRSKIDEQCDEWFDRLLHGPQLDKDTLVRGTIPASVTDEVYSLLMTPVPLENEVELPMDHEDWTPYVSTKLPWTPLTPAFGLEQFGIPVPRRNAEAWRHFDVSGMIQQDYSLVAPRNGIDYAMEEDDHKEEVAHLEAIQATLEAKGVWMDDQSCEARLVYVDGRFVPRLSKTNDRARNLGSGNDDEMYSDELLWYLSRLTDGFTDELAVPVPNGPPGHPDTVYQTLYSRLSGPDHCLGKPISQFAINTQQGTACFAALNTLKTGAVAYVHAPAQSQEVDDKPVLVINAITESAGLGAGDDNEMDLGVSVHPRTLIVADEGSTLGVVQSSVDLRLENDVHRPKLVNGYTQVFVKDQANLTHTYLEETGGVVTAAVELSDEQWDEMQTKRGLDTSGKRPRDLEAERPELKDTRHETIDVHVMGGDSFYKSTIMSLGGCGHVRIAQSVSLLQPGASTEVSGFSLCGGAQRSDIKTNIHHIAQGTTSRQVQKNMIGGRSTGAFRGRVRVEQSAQQSDSKQLSRTLLLSDRSRAWAIPSLEIIADDVQCAHGATVSDLSEEEVFYLQSRGLNRLSARNLLMYAFVGEICSTAHPSLLKQEDKDKDNSLTKRIMRRQENLVPQLARAAKGFFQSI